MTGETDKRKPNMKISELVRAFKDLFIWANLEDGGGNENS